MRSVHRSGGSTTWESVEVTFRSAGSTITGERSPCRFRPAGTVPIVPERIEYDEFGLFHENAEEFGLPYDGPPVVRRVSVELEPGRHLSGLVWGNGQPELVLIHGGAQNAHTWDTVAMALDT